MITLTITKLIIILVILIVICCLSVLLYLTQQKLNSKIRSKLFDIEARENQNDNYDDVIKKEVAAVNDTIKELKNKKWLIVFILILLSLVLIYFILGV